jgi:lysophospholipase
LVRPELRFASATVSAPLLGLKMAVPGYKKALAYGLSSVWGSLQLASELDPSLLSRDPLVQAAYAKDLLVHSKATPRFFTELQKVMADTLRRTDGCEAPLLIQVPLADGIVDSDVTLAYVRALGDDRKELKTYSDFRHESYNEVGKEKAFEDLKKWITRHSTKPS